MSVRLLRVRRFAPALLFACLLPAALRGADSAPPWSRDVTIHRDAWGVPHIHGKTDAAMLFGMGYAQAEDYLWQVEDNCIRALGRHAEVVGEEGVRNDVLNRSFEIPRRSREDFENLPDRLREQLVAFASGLNWYLERHPGVKPRLLTRYEPWHVIAIDRHVILSFVYGRSHVGRPKAGTFEAKVSAATGSNQWAIAPGRTANGHAMLFINPHQPWYGQGQYYEAHLYSDEGTNFSGAGFYGSPIPNLGHNGRLGWAYTVNDPDIADAYRVEFPDAEAPLRYRYGDGTREATEWTDTIRVKVDDGLADRTMTFRKSHHGPLVSRENETTWTAVRIAGLFDANRARQAFGMLAAKDFAGWRAAVSLCAIPMFNIAYADQDGNIFYVYNGAIPIRDPRFDWTRTQDGADPRTEWQGVFAFDDLPQVLNPPSGWVQNCNSTPFLTTDLGSPSRNDFAAYMIEDRDHDTRRAQVSRHLLRNASALTFEKLEALAFDTTMYWPLTELPRFRRDLERLESLDPQRAARVRPFLEHLLGWDCRASNNSTEATLCIAWYAELYGEGYPAETIEARYRDDRLTRLDALVVAAETLRRVHGDWKVAWGEVHRIQRLVERADVKDAAVRFNGFVESLPCPGAPGPLGIVYTVYSTPSMPVVRPRRYAVVGASYVAAIEFAPRVRAASATQFGQSADPSSPHYLDQARLFSQSRLKPAWFYPEDVLANAKRSYHPGEE